MSFPKVGKRSLWRKTKPLFSYFFRIRRQSIRFFPFFFHECNGIKKEYMLHTSTSKRDLNEKRRGPRSGDNRTHHQPPPSTLDAKAVRTFSRFFFSFLSSISNCRRGNLNTFFLNRDYRSLFSFLLNAWPPAGGLSHHHVCVWDMYHMMLVDFKTETSKTSVWTFSIGNVGRRIRKKKRKCSWIPPMSQ